MRRRDAAGFPADISSIATVNTPTTRALVTGCAGFIGSHLAETLLSDGQPVLGIDCFNDNYARAAKLRNLRHLSEWDAFEFVPIDLARGELDEIVEEVGVVFHLAAEPGVRSSWGDRYSQYLTNNVLATQHLLEALKRHTGRRLVYASSSSVYGDAEQRPTPETATLRPRSPYGQTKVAMEHLCELYHANFGVDVVGLRYFTVFGPRQRPDMAFHRLCRAALTGSRFTVFGDGRQSRDFTYVDDIVRATRNAASAELNAQRIFNVGGGAPASLREVIDMLGELAQQPLRVEYDAAEHGDVRDTAADTTSATRILGFSPSVALRDGLASELAWAQSTC